MIQADVSIAQWFFIKKLEAMAVPDVSFCICLSHSCGCNEVGGKGTSISP